MKIFENDEDEDYLEEDKLIYDQKYCCVSFVEPTNEILNSKEIFIIDSYLKYLAKNYIIKTILNIAEIADDIEKLGDDYTEIIINQNEKDEKDGKNNEGKS